MPARSPEALANQLEAKRRHYRNNRAAYIERAKTARAALAAEVRALKEARPCADCGQQFPYYVMDYDHRGDKVDGVSRLLGRGASRKAVLAEIAKCDLVCANCHRIRTYNRATNLAV